MIMWLLNPSDNNSPCKVSRFVRDFKTQAWQKWKSFPFCGIFEEKKVKNDQYTPFQTDFLALICEKVYKYLEDM